VRLQRTQVYLDQEVSEALDRLARRRGTTRSDLIRLATRQFVEQEEVARPGSILELAGLGHGGQADVSERHDDYLVEYKLGTMRP
jgi:ribbon-helix-helix CopG family protein